MLLASLVAAGCQKDETAVTLKAVTEHLKSADKSFIDNDRFTCWSNGDVVWINDNCYAVNIADGECTISGIPRSDAGYVAFYPASLATDNTVATGSAITNLCLPDVYTYREGEVPVVMAAYLNSATGAIAFHNACMVLQLNLYNNHTCSLRIASIRISNTHAPLSGMFQITGLNGDVPALSAQGDNRKNMSVKIDDTSPITIAPGGNATVYVVLPPTDAYPYNRFTVEVDAVDPSSSGSNFTLYQFTHRQSDNVSGCFQRNMLVPINIQLNSPHTVTLKGQGTANNPYQISSYDDLAAMERLVNMGYAPIGASCQPFASAYYRMTNNIDAWGRPALHPIGTYANNFTGHFDGDGNYIDGLHIEGEECVGLFGYISHGAVIRRLELDGIYLTATDVNTVFAGNVCGHADGATIDRCYSSAMDLTCSAANAYIGYVVGEMTGERGCRGVVSNCYSGYGIMGVSIPQDNNAYFFGGVVGHLVNSTVVNAYIIDLSFVYVPDSYIGGIVGCADGDSYIVNCYAGYVYWLQSVVPGKTADICAVVGSQCHINYCYYHENLFAVGAPPVTNTLNNLKYISYRQAAAEPSGGRITLTDYLQYYVDRWGHSFSTTLCPWSDELYNFDPESPNLNPEQGLGPYFSI